MFLRHKVRRKDGKEHRYWSIVENRRVAGGRTVQRHVRHLGEINDNQRAAWCQTIEALDAGGQHARQIALFPEDRAGPALDCDVVHVRLSGLQPASGASDIAGTSGRIAFRWSSPWS